MNLNFPKLEKKILKFWQKNKIFEKSIKQRKRVPAKRVRNFVFYEGPPTANARPGFHHVLARVYKDIICRYKAMRGFRVLRKAGWDTHGLPVELEIEKKLGLKSKKDIEKYGVAKFNRLCRESVWNYKKDWEKLTERIAFWLDMENPYITYEPEYIETVWWIIKEIWKKGLLYQDFKVVPYCPRCQTSLSSHEVAQGYEKIKEPAIYLKFRILNPEFKNSSLLVWTTTPWTLPGNVAVAVNPKCIYAKVKAGVEYLILAKERLQPTLRPSIPPSHPKKEKEKNYQIVKKFKGKDLVGLRYQALYPLSEEISKRAYRVIPADFVSLEEGTGLVHIAPAFGEEDMQVGKENNLPILLNVDEEGKFKAEVKNWAGMFVKEADPLIIEDLKKRNILFREELYEHDYPFCWRCDSPLLYYAKQSWFINIQKVKKDLMKNNQRINWIPAHLKEGRFGEWLKEVKDWNLSRERYWGTPLPVWQCKKCGHLEVIGSKKDLIKQKFSTNKYYILRHGQTIYQTKRKEWTYPRPEKEPILLTPEGRNQIKKAAKELKDKKIDLIYSSDFSRTRQAAEIMAKELGIKVIFDKRLRDINLGIYHGRSKKEQFYKDFPVEIASIYDRKPPGGENWGQVRKRMVDCLSDIDKRHRNKIILIVSHGDPLWLLRGAMEGLGDKKLLDIKIKGTDIKTGKWKKIDYKKIPIDKAGRLNFHRPYIDEVKFYCKKCGKIAQRVPEVIDCWFDSGSMPFAQYHYPFENRKLIDEKKQFPADYISEGVDQTRGWFYTLHAISTLLGRGPAYKNVISLGHVLDEKGEKMSKSKGNVVDSWYIIEKYGSDATRWYFYTVNQPGDAKLFSERDVDQALKKFILTFWNCFAFFKTYAAKKEIRNKFQIPNPKHTLDNWIVSRLQNLIKEATQRLDKYDVTGAARAIENFVIENLSLWHIRRSRRRFQKPETKKEFKEASEVLNYVLLTLSKLTAPFTPFLSEQIHQCARFYLAQSVHLEDWPGVNKKMIDRKLEKKMEKVREIVARALSERAKAKIKVRQPLNELRITNYELRNEPELLELIKEEVNVKKIMFGKTLKLDTRIALELKEEGLIREVIRQIQEMRKKAGYKPRHRILAQYFGTSELNKILMKNKNFIQKEAKVKEFVLSEKQKKVFDVEKKIEVNQEKLWLGIQKL